MKKMKGIKMKKNYDYWTHRGDRDHRNFGLNAAAGGTSVEELKRDYTTRPELIFGVSSSTRLGYVNENKIKLIR